MTMTKLIPAIYEHGILTPLKPLNLPEHQKVLVIISINDDDIPSLFISKLAEQSQSFQFLQHSEEDIYSPSDGEEIK